jgi:3-deoxy-D-manno-octulosonic-acid transferase
MITFIYNLLAIVALPFVLAYHYYRSVTRGRPASFAERFGQIAATELEELAGHEVIWVHAVSVGETIAALPLIRGLRQRFPGKKIVVSNVTETGREVALKSSGADLCIYFPFDYPFAVNAALLSIHPAVILIMETELWPNFIRRARELAVPVLLVNGRISDRSFRNYLRFAWFFRPILNDLAALCMQSGEDARRIIAMGAPPERVEVTRNLKYDISVPRYPAQALAEVRNSYLLPPGALIFTAGSTHEGEDALVIAAYQRTLAAGKAVFLVLVPRHPERAASVAGLLAGAGLSCTLRSTLAGRSRQFAAGEVLLVDTVGELLNLYAVSDVVFVGGSLVPTGGHNVLEPAALRVPVIFGPHMDNFREIAALVLASRAGIRAADGEELAVLTCALLDDDKKRLEMGANGARLIEENSGSTTRHLAVIARFMGN